MIPRKMEGCFRAALADYPTVTLFGPRQSGKTTLAKALCPSFGYVSFEDKETRDFAAADYKAFFQAHPPPLILDEVQRLPEIVSAVQTMVDADRERCGRFVLTGSQQASLAQAVDESLAGRTAVLDLLPLSLDEIPGRAESCETNELLLRGFMPELYRTRHNPTMYYRNYFRTYVERDVRRLVNLKDMILFEKFVTLLAGRIGQLLNFSSLADEVGVSKTTISTWTSVLEASFLVFRLPPYFANVSKRVVKSPKLYFTDVGLASYLLGLETPAQIARDPLRGHLFENLIVADVRKRFTNAAKDPTMFFFRDDKGFEIDLLVGSVRNARPIEIKSAMTFHPDMVRNLDTFMTKDSAAHDPILVYDGAPIPSFGPNAVAVRNYRDLQLFGD